MDHAFAASNGGLAKGTPGDVCSSAQKETSSSSIRRLAIVLAPSFVRPPESGGWSMPGQAHFEGQDSRAMTDNPRREAPPELRVPRPDESAPADEVTMARAWLTHLR